MRALAQPLALLLLALVSAPLAAQQTPTSASLDAIERMVHDGRYDAARAALERWQADSANAPAARRTSAAMLRARLQTDGTAAQHAYLGVALGNPFASEAGAALLRVGQAALLLGDTAGARTYLRRLVDDFPTSPRRGEALLWLSRTHDTRGNATRACEVAREGLATGPASDVAALLRRQEEAQCPGSRTTAARAAGSANEGAGSHAVQLGAFRTESGARALASRAQRAGFDARIVRTPANDLMRVRVGRLTGTSDAVTLRDRLRAAGFEAVVVSDVPRERAAP